MRVVAGRGFATADIDRSDATFVINRTLARLAFEGVNPIGQRIALWSPGLTGTVVGVVDDVRQHGVGQPANPTLYMTRFHTKEFLPVLDDGLYFAARVRGDVNAVVQPIQKATRDVTPGAAVYRVATVDQIVSDSLRRPRAYAALFIAFAVLACALVAAGLFGVTTFLIRQRRRELGIRVAVGASPRDVVTLVTRDTLITMAVGTCAGLGLAIALAASVRSLLFGVGTSDVTSYALATLALVGIAVIAAYLPARRVGTMNPATVLRVD
jgi:hypothetical protein